MKFPSSVAKAVEFYLETRRGFGFALVGEGRILDSLAGYARRVRHCGPLTNQLVLAWACLPAQADRLWWARRLEAAQRLARFWHALDPRVQIPPTGVFGPAYRRPDLHLFSRKEISDLMDATDTLTPTDSLRPITFRALIGLLASTGLRISEALRLRQTDFDAEAGTLLVERSKFGQSRCLPLHRSVIRELQRYQRARDKRFKRPERPALFVSLRGQALSYAQASKTFRILRRHLGWKQSPRPRLHNLRHTFAVTRLSAWYRQGQECMDQKILALCTYLGHRNIRHTYWYLSATPQLLALITSRLPAASSRPG